ncbi:MAG TPA: PQQ-dependent sugar dehydrogenase, partial [Vicinamibacterales bacterium]|nr:PQQ-dependent sugar dehydrogenase [Vicinamibacterales bacterium]
MNSPTLVTACLSSGSPAPCYDVRVVASGIDSAAAMTSLPDGRLAFVEGEHRVRIIASRALVPEPALAVDPSHARIVGLVADPNFIATRMVFVSWIERRASGESVLNVTRYREVQNEFGEGATIVTGIPVPERAVVPLAADPAGRLYVAIPASASGGAGHVARFGFDGSVPRDGLPFSPVFAEGYASPTGLAVTPGANQLWLGGNSSGDSEALSSISLQTNAASQWPLRRRAVRQGQFGDLSFVSLTRPAASANSSQNPAASTVLVGAGRRLFVGLVSAAGIASGFDQVRFDPDVQVQAAAPAPDGSI